MNKINSCYLSTKMPKISFCTLSDEMADIDWS